MLAKDCFRADFYADECLLGLTRRRVTSISGAWIKEAIANGSWLNSGRPKGSRNKLGEDLIAALAEDFAKHGKGAIETVRQDRPAAYLNLMLHPRRIFDHAVDQQGPSPEP